MQQYVLSYADGRGSAKPMARLALPDEGSAVTFDVQEPSHFIDEIMSAVGSNRLRRPVTPIEGRVYIDALAESLTSSTFWSLKRI